MYECTSVAPASSNTSAALHNVPAVSQISSTIIHFFPLTVPITVISVTSPTFPLLLSTIAKGHFNLCANSRALATPPTSGDIIIRSFNSLN